MLIADAAERVAVETVRSCYGTAVHRHATCPAGMGLSCRAENQKAAIRQDFLAYVRVWKSIADAVAPSLQRQLGRAADDQGILVSVAFASCKLSFTQN